MQSSFSWGDGQEPQLGTCVLSPAAAVQAFAPPGWAQTRAAGHRRALPGTTAQRQAAWLLSPTPAQGALPSQQNTGPLRCCAFYSPVTLCKL